MQSISGSLKSHSTTIYTHSTHSMSSETISKHRVTNLYNNGTVGSYIWFCHTCMYNLQGNRQRHTNQQHSEQPFFKDKRAALGGI